MLLNVSIFIWFGAVCPWYSFAHNDVIPIYRLIFLGILILLLRRPPIVFALHSRIHQIEEWRQALFVGFFGPIGVSAIFYLYVTLEFLRTQVLVDGHEREDAERLAEVINVVVWFVVICSVVSQDPLSSKAHTDVSDCTWFERTCWKVGTIHSSNAFIGTERHQRRPRPFSHQQGA